MRTNNQKPIDLEAMLHDKLSSFSDANEAHHTRPVPDNNNTIKIGTIAKSITSKTKLMKTSFLAFHPKSVSALSNTRNGIRDNEN